MEETLFFMGIALIFLGFFLMMIAAFVSGTGKLEGGGVVFIGPFPIGFATSKRMMYLLLMISLIIFFMFLIFGKRFV